MDDDYKPAFQTERFDVFHHRVVRNPAAGFLPRDLYTAWFRVDDVPRPVCEITVGIGGFVEWLHVCETYRRQGIATEVLRALEEHRGQLDICGATVAGEAFCEAYIKGDDDAEAAQAPEASRMERPVVQRPGTDGVVPADDPRHRGSGGLSGEVAGADQ